ncbi:sigma-70 family RNA polymerase sigma factor [Actinoplanes palleronii]|uniref:RNA polymerase sigma-70 region 2 domain-containing protein n=1 Tax=Actinoplanes palleronii TaxID=113570 RepID=A0ABQ4BQP8_9ACTN|nr:sigma-70 family RNA polymerase sigma factor [Actinoplanes palleronii]GIE72993.1 hypothetical protein Apa02nite_091010 [Actinoplanes palleronii]
MADVAAARAGDQRALDDLVAEYLPLIYNIVGRALASPADVDDVVQDVMLEMVRDLRTLRDPAALRSWLVAIAMRHVRRHWRQRRAAPPRAAVADAELTADPGADFADLTVSALHLTGQRREVAQATRWLDADDRELLSLWWLEAAGQLSRAELAAALQLSGAQAAVRVQRMKAQLDTARIVVRAMRATPPCPILGAVTREWDGRPDGLWRKRIARHVRECQVCDRVLADVIPAERLLAGLPLVLPAPGHAAVAVPRATRHRWLSGKAVTVPAAALVLVAALAAVVLNRSPEPAPVTESQAQPVSPAAASTAPASVAPSAPASPSRPAPSTTPSKKPAPPAAADATFPVRAAFYYPWYGENFTEVGSHFHPSAGRYSVDDPATVDRQIKDMRYAGLQAGISSWWGRGKREDKRLPLLLERGAKLDFSWSVYYEPEGYGDPTPAQIRSDLAYLGRYTSSPAFLHVDGKPVIFVWAGDGDSRCAVADRWRQASQTFYVVLKVFGGYTDCRHQPDSWHQYGVGVDVQKGYSAIAGPGFWLYSAATPTLDRDPARFRKQVTEVAASGEPWQLIISYNEWGEGTAIESATEWKSASGHGVYADILHDVFNGG